MMATTKLQFCLQSLPKSGTEFLWEGLRDATGLPRPQQNQTLIDWYLTGYCDYDEAISTGIFTSERLNLMPLGAAFAKGCVIGTHAPATHHNLCVLRDGRIHRVTVLIRDPRDSTVSWTHHLRAIGPRMRDFNTLAQHLPNNYYEWPPEQQLSYQVRNFLPAAMNWIESWLDAQFHMPSITVQIITFDELANDPIGMFERVLSFHKCQNYDTTRIQPARPGSRHFRKGISGQWQGEFSSEDQVLARLLIDDRMTRLRGEYPVLDRAGSPCPARI